MKYKSEAKILLVGSGADEQCAGYGRHRTKYRNGRCSFVIFKQLTFAICLLPNCETLLLIKEIWVLSFLLFLLHFRSYVFIMTSCVTILVFTRFAKGTEG